MREPIKLTEEQLAAITPIRNVMDQNGRNVAKLKEAVIRWVKENRKLDRDLWAKIFEFYPDLKVPTDPNVKELLCLSWDTGEILTLDKEEEEDKEEVRLILGREIA